ncbi:MAG: apolipoprotein acyltransferase [Paracoccaceae bacterium]
MIVIILAIIGAIAGVIVARRNNGNRLDKLQYGTVFAIAFGLLGLILTVAIERML